jgi:5-methylthioadenosine/S-adenosylhomocysteine deaminase
VTVRRMALSALVLFAFLLPLSGQDAREKVDILIRGGTVLTMNPRRVILPDGAVAIRGNRIVEVGSSDAMAAAYAAARTVDASGKVVMPGLINTHTHAPMVLFRGLADDEPLEQWLQKTIFPAEARNVNEDFVRRGTRLACLEMIQGGTTTFVDIYYFENAIADETAKAGLRGVLGQAILDFPAPDNKTWPEMVAAAGKFLTAWKDHPLVTPAVAPHATYTVSAEHLREAQALAGRHGAPLLIHVAETRAETKTIAEKYGVTPVGFLESIGFLGENVIAAHGVWVNETDIATLARRKVGVAHCPQSNMKLASGTAPVPAMLAAGVAVGLGTDGAASNNDLDLWEEADTAAKLQKLVLMQADALPAAQALEMATIGGARVIKREKDLGSLEAGKLADLIVVGMGAAHVTPLYNVTSQLVYATKASDVEAVMVNGRFLMENRRVLTLDVEKVKADARALREKIQKSVQAP